MKLAISYLLWTSLSLTLAQAQLSRIEQTIHPLEAESHLRFLTADELKGRDTGTEELIIAGRYIAEQFRKYGVQPLGDKEDDFLQRVPLSRSTKASKVELALLGEEFQLNNNLLLVSGSNTALEAELIFLETVDQYQNMDVAGKIILTVLGDKGFTAPLVDLKKAGAVGLIQLYRPGWRYPWPLLANYFNREKVNIGEANESVLPHLWLRDTAKVYVDRVKEAMDLHAALTIEGISSEPIKAYNIVGKIEGTDANLKQEHLVMTAHYDHVGIQHTQDPDSIYNGTRDNGIGTTAILNAANYFGKHPPKRSVIFVALTAEEKGLLGSKYYADHPKIPLEETVMNLNIDNSGYTDNEYIWLLDTNRTNIDDLVYRAASELDLKVMGDRVPEQNYYERSDQASFAMKGVPAINFKMSMTAYDERITKYYHKPADEFETVDLEYIHRYWKAYILAAELIGNRQKKPYWIKGDKFEKAGDELYGRKE